MYLNYNVTLYRRLRWLWQNGYLLPTYLGTAVHVFTAILALTKKLDTRVLTQPDHVAVNWSGENLAGVQQLLVAHNSTDGFLLEAPHCIFTAFSGLSKELPSQAGRRIADKTVFKTFAGRHYTLFGEINKRRMSEEYSD